MKIEIPDNIDLSRAERYVLTIRVEAEHYAFSLYSPTENASYFYCPIEKNKSASAFQTFQNAYFDNEFFALPFRKVYILNYTPVFTYIPSLIFEHKDKDAYLDFLFLEQPGKTIHHSLPAKEMTILHKMPEEDYVFLHHSFPGASIIHHSAPVIAYFQSRGRIINREKMVVNLQGEGLDVFCFSKDNFLLGNHFRCSDLMDAVYYILFIWKQLKFDQLKDFVYVAGDLESKRDLIDNLKIYFQNVIPSNIVPEAHFERVNTRIIPFEMACLSLCEL